MNKKKLTKIVLICLASYVLLVVSFESVLGYFQPQAGTTMTITTFDTADNDHERVVARLESGGNIYVAANHWPRAWYRQVLANPRILVNFEEETREFRAVRVTGDEHERVDSDNSLGLMFRFLTGFPPRYFVRLDPG